MRLEAVSLRGVRDLAPVELRLPQGGPIVVTGPSAAGKTTCLEAIIAAKEAWAPYGPPPLIESFFDTPEGAVTLEWRASDNSVARSEWRSGAAIDQAPSALRAEASTYAFSPDSFKVEYMPAGRRFETGAHSSLGTPRVEQSRRVRAVAGKYDWVRSHLETVAMSNAAVTARRLRERGVVLGQAVGSSSEGFSDTLAVLSPNLRWLGAEDRTGGAAGLACLFERRSGRVAELAQLTGGEQAVVLIAAAYSALGLRRSLLLVDLPEQGLHPEDHAAFFGRLTELMSGGQLIVATTSPAILRAAPPQSVFVLR